MASSGAWPIRVPYDDVELVMSERPSALSPQTIAELEHALALAMPDLRIREFFTIQPRYFPDAGMVIAAFAPDGGLGGVLVSRLLAGDGAERILHVSMQLIAERFRRTALLKRMWGMHLAAAAGECGLPGTIVMRTCNPIVLQLLRVSRASTGSRSIPRSTGRRRSASWSGSRCGWPAGSAPGWPSTPEPGCCAGPPYRRISTPTCPRPRRGGERVFPPEPHHRRPRAVHRAHHDGAGQAPLAAGLRRAAHFEGRSSMSTTTSTIAIRPRRLRQYGAPEDAVFCLVTNPALADVLALEECDDYRDATVVLFGPDDPSFEELLRTRIPQRSHVLVVSPDRFFASPPPAALGPDRKLLAMACNSTPTSLDEIAYFLDVIERTDPLEQAEFARGFFERLEDAEYVRFVNPQTGTSMRFDHFAQSYEWNQQAGVLEWGEQQIAPSGEISVLPIRISGFRCRTSSCASAASLTPCRGYPILHSGTPSMLREDQARIYGKLSDMQDHPVIATVENGRATAFRDFDGRASAPAVEMLRTLCEVDSRYGLVWEMGFACNTALTPLARNCAMNEVYGATAGGAMHFGLGLTPFTQYHLDIICPTPSSSTSAAATSSARLGERAAAGRSRSAALGGQPGQGPPGDLERALDHRLAPGVLVGIEGVADGALDGGRDLRRGGSAVRQPLVAAQRGEHLEVAAGSELQRDRGGLRAGQGLAEGDRDVAGDLGRDRAAVLREGEVVAVPAAGARERIRLDAAAVDRLAVAVGTQAGVQVDQRALLAAGDVVREDRAPGPVDHVGPVPP